MKYIPVVILAALSSIEAVLAYPSDSLVAMWVSGYTFGLLTVLVMVTVMRTARDTTARR